MKKIFSLLITVILLFTFCACGESVNMGMLTEYQNHGFETELKISSGGKEYRAKLTKNGEILFLSLEEPAGLEDFTFMLTENGASVVADGAEIPLASGELLRFSNIYGLFSVPVAGTWKIEKAHPGGVALYICENESTVLYIDANSHLPLKIISGDTVADILSFTVTS